MLLGADVQPLCLRHHTVCAIKLLLCCLQLPRQRGVLTRMPLSFLIHTALDATSRNHAPGDRVYEIAYVRVLGIRHLDHAIMASYYGLRLCYGIASISVATNTTSGTISRSTITAGCRLSATAAVVTAAAIIAAIATTTTTATAASYIRDAIIS
jgi:hypothetical protein